MPSRIALLFVLLLGIACRDGGNPIVDPGPVVHTLVRLAGDSMSDTVAQPLTRLTVRAEDKDRNPLAGIGVRFFVPLGSNGDLDTTIVRTNSEGIATSGIWTLGTRSGAQFARVHAQDVATVFTAVALPEVAVALMRYAGDNQVTQASSPVRVPPAVRAVDRFGNGVPDVPVTFVADASSIDGGAAVTDSTGVAEAIDWKPAGSATAMSLQVHSALLPGAIVTFTARVVPVLYNIQFRTIGAALSPRLQQAVERAAARWMSVFSDHGGISQVVLPAGGCVASSPAVAETVTDVLIFVRVTPIDGHGNILASAAPCAFHEETGLPVVARITFDSTDVAEYVANDWIDLIATHELGHALGFGTTWVKRGLLAGAGSTDPHFTGPAAKREYNSAFGMGGTGVVPVENTGGAGTADRHWRSSLFPTETMNGFIASARAPLSRITIAAMEDVGYRVDYAGADVYPVVTVSTARVEMRHEPMVELAAQPKPVMRTVRNVRGGR